MRVTDLWISNFRSFGASTVHITLPDTLAPIAIVGPNNAGKSNLVAALLNVLAQRPTHPGAFSARDIHLCTPDSQALIRARIEPPLKSVDAFNHVKEMPQLVLSIDFEDGVISTSHHFADSDGSRVFNARSIKRNKTREYSKEDKELLLAYQRSGSEQVQKWKAKLPVYYLGPETLTRELRSGRYSLLRKVIDQLRVEFLSDDCLVKDEPGVAPRHVGLPRHKVYRAALEYLEKHILPTPAYKSLLDRLEAVLHRQLELDAAAFRVNLSPPDASTFFEDLSFSIRDNPSKPALPLESMGTGFLSLFAVALLRALINAEVGGSIFIIEEPESYLHEHYQAYFYDVLTELAANNQVICTTHSKKFVDVFRPETIIRVSNPSQMGSLVTTSAKATERLQRESGDLPLESPHDIALYLRTLEPNLGNIAFASKVVIVEGPHDLLAYSLPLEQELKLGLRNIAIVAAWGKDTIPTIAFLCRALRVPCYSIHDWDISSEGVSPSSLVSPNPGVLRSLSPHEKAQFTKNLKIFKVMGPQHLHQNQPRLEAVLGIPDSEKSTLAVHTRLAGLSVSEVRQRYPGLIPDSLLGFLNEPSPT